MKNFSFICDICHKEYSNKSVLKQHSKTHLVNKPWKCSQCSREFCQKSKLAEHLNRHQGTPPFKCGECEKGFYQKDRLKTHKLTHTNERPFECNKCALSFRRKFELNKHTRIHDKALVDKIKKFVCEICNKKNYSLADLNRHALKHSDTRNYKCQYCEKAFKDKYTLKCHEVIIHYHQYS
jgi:KRAB domain-containing zinc finger protein